MNHRSLIWILAALLAALLLFSFAQAGELEALQLQVTAVWQKAFYETVTLMDAAASDLDKLLVSDSPAREQELLGSISRQAEAAQDNLSMLPASLPLVSGSLKFVNQLSDYARTLADRLASGDQISSEDHGLLASLSDGCRTLNALLSETAWQMESGQDPLQAANLSDLTGDTDSDGQTEPSVSYPALLYDGPFSDSRNTDRLLALGDAQFSPSQAEDAARRFVGEERVLSVQLTGEGSTPVPCYELTVHVPEGKLDLAVTKQGGQIVYMLCSTPPQESRFSQAELIDLAAAFLKSRGYPETVISYWSFDENLLTASFATVQDGVVLYPDLLKVQMSAQTGLPVGFEAINYLSCHTLRTGLEPTLSEAEAEALLASSLKVELCRLCIIPTDEGEALAYEFGGTYNGARYLVYIDAHTGLERIIYRVVEDENGQLAL